MIEVSERFDVPAPPAAVWAVLSDPNQVVACVPGASLGDQQPDGSYDASLAVKFGPTRITFRARFKLDLDEPALQGKIIAQGRDALGGARLQATADFTVIGETSSTVTLEGQVEITGRLASLIESGATAVVKRVSGEFAAALAERCAAGTSERRQV